MELPTPGNNQCYGNECHGSPCPTPMQSFQFLIIMGSEIIGKDLQLEASMCNLLLLQEAQLEADHM